MKKDFISEFIKSLQPRHKKELKELNAIISLMREISKESNGFSEKLLTEELAELFVSCLKELVNQNPKLDNPYLTSLKMAVALTTNFFSRKGLDIYYKYNILEDNFNYQNEVLSKKISASQKYDIKDFERYIELYNGIAGYSWKQAFFFTSKRNNKSKYKKP